MKTKTMGERLTLLRDEYGLTPERLAALLNITRVAVDNIEKGISQNPRGSTIDNIVTRLGTTHEWLLNGSGEMLPNGRVQINQPANTSMFDPATDTLYKELKEQIHFLRDTIKSLTGNNRNFRQALNGTGFHKRKSLRAAA